MEQENKENIIYHITPDQAKKICIYFNEDYKKLEDYEICNYLDTIIDNL